jgi:hypothetical protein
VQETLFADAPDQLARNENDIVYTPDAVAKMIVDEFKPSGSVLEPCKGGGAFLRYLPDAEWCEIQEGRDFFDYTKQVDWIVSNPPYSLWDEWIVHSMSIAQNIVYLVPFAKVFKLTTLRQILHWGGIVKVVNITPQSAGFPFGFPCGAFYFRKGYKGPMEITLTL